MGKLSTITTAIIINIILLLSTMYIFMMINVVVNIVGDGDVVGSGGSGVVIIIIIIIRTVEVRRFHHRICYTPPYPIDSVMILNTFKFIRPETSEIQLVLLQRGGMEIVLDSTLAMLRVAAVHTVVAR